MLLFCPIEAESSPFGDAGGSVDENVLDAILQWLWKWWRSCSVQARQVSECWATVIHCVVLCELLLVEDSHWLAGITDWSLGPSSDKETDWTWVHSTDIKHLYNTMFEKLSAALVTKPAWCFIGTLVWVNCLKYTQSQPVGQCTGVQLDPQG